MENSTKEQFSNSPSLLRLWYGVLIGPFAWAGHLGASYAAVTYLCESGGATLFHVFSAIALALAASGFLLSLTAWRGAGKPRHTLGQGVDGRTSLLTVAGLATGGFFFVVIAAQTVPQFFFSPCT